ncbi:MAG: ArsR/SmtB family transcription factor [Candidatus Thorarchaeota archaeon]|jgi:predicted transcriptional regulator
MFIPPDRKIFKRYFRLAIAGTRGGIVRLEILGLVGEKPRTISELSGELSLNYKTVEYHIRVLKKSGLMIESGKKYKNLYCLSNVMKMNRDVIEEFTKELRKTK